MQATSALEAIPVGGLVISLVIKLQDVATWAAIVAAVFAVLAVVVPLLLRWWDSRSHLKIDYYLGDSPPDAWMIEAGITRQWPPVSWAIFRVENVGARAESLSDAYLSLPGRGKVHRFTGGNPPMPSQLPPGHPRVWAIALKDFARILVNEGCTGTARVDLVIRLGRGALHPKRIEVPSVEEKAAD